MVQRRESADAGDCHEVRRHLELLDLPYQRKRVDIIGGPGRTSDFLTLDLHGWVPLGVRDDGCASVAMDA
jgi:glutathione S-transferase